MTTAVQSCRASIAHHSKSFALASRLLPAKCRDDAAVVYAWCRRADDAVDLNAGQAQVEALSRLGAELKAIEAGAHLDDDVLMAFADVLRRHQVPRVYPEELLAGMQMDVQGHRYHGFGDLMLYSYRVASTVGLMMCHVMGVNHPRALRHAAHLGLAMQLTNICRDVREDWERQRLYLPDDLLRRHGVADLRAALGGPLPETACRSLRGAIRDTLSVADQYYASADVGLQYLSPRSALAVDVARRVYATIGDVLASQGHDVRAPRAVVPGYRKLATCGAALLAMGGRWLRHHSHSSSCPSLPLLAYGPELLTP